MTQGKRSPSQLELNNMITRIDNFRRRHRGMTSMLAMLYLVLISALSLGFYASTTISSQLSNNDERVARAYLASETGMDFMRQRLARVRIPTATPPAFVIDELYDNLQTELNGTSNVGGGNISRNGNIIKIPRADRSPSIIRTSAASQSRSPTGQVKSL